MVANDGGIILVLNHVAKAYKEREKAILHLILSYGFPFYEIGVFGSYARGDYKTTSDIDVCIITDNKPSNEVTGDLRMRAEEFGADVIFVTPEYYKNSQDLFARNIRNDYRRVEYEE